MGTRFLNLLEKLGVVGDHVPSEDRGDDEEAGEYIVKLCQASGSLVGGGGVQEALPFSSIYKINHCSFFLVVLVLERWLFGNRQMTRKYPKCHVRERWELG